MRVHSQVSEVETGGILETSDFSLDEESIGKLMTIFSSNIYSDKIAACIREPVCNAWDANPNQPFDVHLPSRFEPYFSVRDYGPGLCHEHMMTLYNSYGKSLKDKSQSFIGGFGVGSKAPFAYNETFNVTSWHGGEKRVYSCIYKKGASKPTANLMHQEKSDEPPGLEVYVPVKAEDTFSFREKAAEILSRFSPAPNVTGVADFQMKTYDVALESKQGSWRILRDSARPYVIMGNVAYPIDVNVLDKLSEQAKFLLQCSLEIECPIGSVEVAVSREDLQYEPHVVDYLKQRLDGMYAEIVKDIEDALKACKTDWDAAKHLRQTLSGYGVSKLRSRVYASATWQGKPIPQNWRVELPGGVKSPWRMVGIGSELLTRDRPTGGHYHTTYHVSVDYEYYVYLDDGKIGPYSRIWHKHKDQKHIVVVITSTDRKKVDPKKIKNWKHLQRKFEKCFPGIAVELLSSLEKPPANKQQRAYTTPVKQLTKRPYSGYGWDDTTLSLDKNLSGFYVEFYGGEPEKLGKYALENLYSAAVELEIVDPITAVYGIPASYKSRLQKALADGAPLVDLIDHVKKIAPSVAKKHKKILQQQADLQDWNREIIRSFNTVLEYLGKERASLPANSIAVDILDTFKQPPAITPKEQETAKAAEKLLSTLGGDYRFVPDGSNSFGRQLRAAQNKWTFAYPLLSKLATSRYADVSTQELPHILEYVVLKSR